MSKANEPRISTAADQKRMQANEDKRIRDLNRAFMELVTDKQNPLTRSDLAALIKRRPEKYGRFAGFLETLPH